MTGKKESPLEQIFNQIPVHIYFKDIDGKYLNCNLAQAKLFGFTAPSMVSGKTDFDFCDEKTATEIIASDKKIISESKHQYLEETVKIDGEFKTYLSHKIPAISDDGKPYGIMGISFDITERKRDEWLKDQLIKELLDKIPGHVFWKDKQGIYLGCNLRQAKALGENSESSVVGKSDFDLNLKDPDSIYQNDQIVMTTQKPLSVEEKVEIDGHEMYFLSHKIPLVENEISTGLVGISLDITELKAAEEVKKELEFQKRANEMLKLWGSAIAHEMRTPLLTMRMGLGAISTGIETCLNMPQTQEIAKLHKKLESISKYPNKLQRTIDQANHFIDMTLVKSKSGMDITFNLVPLSIKNEVSHAMENYPFAEGDDALIEVDLAQDFTFMGDSDAFHHILYNLLKNAIQYVKKVRGAKIYISLNQSENHNSLIFKDTGPGISAEHLPHLFKPFFSKSKHGTGVGLSLCKNFMNGFGGDISCESEVNEFTQFELKFPKPKKQGDN